MTDDATLTAVNAALAENDVTRATDLAQAAVMAGDETPLLLNLAAHQRELEGRYQDALVLLNIAFHAAPDDPYILNALGRAYSKSGRARDALAAFDDAVMLDPDLAVAHHGRGSVLSVLGQAREAWRAHARASELDPRFPDPLGSLAALATEAKDYDLAKRLAERALALDPLDVAARLALSTIALQTGDCIGALANADVLVRGARLTDLHEASAQRLRADALDGLDRTQEALGAYQAANEALRRVHLVGVEGAGIELGVEKCQRLRGHFETTTDNWASAPTSIGPTPEGLRGHVFLLGFPRSGTTLLEQVLASHPNVVALEERPTLDPILDAFFSGTPELERLADLDNQDVARQREDYWRRVEGFGVEVADKVFIDKLPLNTIFLPLIAKLFPKAQVIFALRDPRDVVLSCFRRRFKPNALVIEYTSLQRTALFYDGVMRLAELYRSRLPLRVYVHRHETLVESFEVETKALCEFLRLEWRAEMADFVETAQRRDIQTPSAAQVRRGLYREGMGQWRRYAPAIADIAPILEPWIERFNYASTT